ncbi:MAG: hypothetical protein WBA54_11425 [Acidaminobacteraceae bacterium]
MKNSINIKFDDDVLIYLKNKKRSVLTLTINISGGGCCPTIEVVDIDFNIPNNLESYNNLTCDGIDVYISKTAKINTPVLRFKLEKALFFSHIIAVGLNLKSH